MARKAEAGVDDLPEECRRELVDFIWWLSRAPQDVRPRALGMIRPYLDCSLGEGTELAEAVGAATEILREAVRAHGA
jgi:hypothetical protein